jgi:excisionase family DNA binding protein
MDKLLLSVDDVASTLSILRTQVFALIASGELQSLKVGRRRLVPTTKTNDASAPIVLAPSEQPTLHPDIRLTLDVLLAARRERSARNKTRSAA